jgi:hypothetical protein
MWSSRSAGYIPSTSRAPGDVIGAASVAAGLVGSADIDTSRWRSNGLLSTQDRGARHTIGT